tara:strand:+ start:47 stop:1411 length:1365 start_codon:yes stop_codon:yes gene_type:complete
MAFEPSEGLYAGLSLLETTELRDASTNINKFKELYDKAFVNLQDSKLIKDGAGNKTRNGLVSVTTLSGATEKKRSDLYSDCAGAISAVLATRDKVKERIPDCVYLTGNKWNKKVEQFKVDAFGMADYNSSDLILEFSKGEKKDQFIGVSLKKKRKAAAPSPTMINNAFSKFIEGSEFVELRKDLNTKRRRFFAGLIKEATTKKGPLANFAKITGNKSIAQLNPENDVDAKKLWDIRVTTTKTKKVKGQDVNEVVPLINLKDEDTILTEGSAAADVSDKSSDSAFRKFVNERLQSKGNKLNPLYQYFEDAMNVPDVKDKLANALLARVLKTKLLDELDTWDENEFGFYVIEGVGSVNEDKGNVNVSNAAVYDIHTIMCAIAQTRKEEASIKVDKTETFKRNAAKVYFILSKGDKPILDIELRYKGSFTAMPQFFATMTTDFQKLLKDGGCSEIHR